MNSLSFILIKHLPTQLTEEKVAPPPSALEGLTLAVLLKSFEYLDGTSLSTVRLASRRIEKAALNERLLKDRHSPILTAEREAYISLTRELREGQPRGCLSRIWARSLKIGRYSLNLFGKNKSSLQSPPPACPSLIEYRRCKDKLLERENMLAAVAKNGSALEYASAELKNDKEVVLAAVAQNNWAWKFASDELIAKLKNDRKFILAAVAKNGHVLQYANAELKNDKEVVLTAVAQNGFALQCASAELRNDRKVVLVAVA